MKDSSAFLEEIGMSVDELVRLVMCSSIHDVWEEFGEYRTIRRSARPGEYGVLEICYADEDFALSVLLPFNQAGALQGQCRVALSDRERELVCRKIDVGTCSAIYAEVESEILESLPDLSWEPALGAAFCTGDHTHSMRRETNLLRASHSHQTRSEH